MKKNIAPKLILNFLIIVLFGSCNREPEQHIEGAAFGTLYHIHYFGTDSEIPAIRRQTDSILAELNATFSIFDTTSLLCRLNRGERAALNRDFLTVLRASQDIAQKTGGAFDCTCQPLVELWGFGKTKERETVQQAIIDSVMAFTGYRLISLQGDSLVKADPRTQINFNAIAKGYAADRVSRFLKAQGYTDHIVEIGGEIVACGAKHGKAWKVGIQTPTETADGAIESMRHFKMQDKAVATSGNYRNYFEENGVRYTHILDPTTGRPEQTILLSVSVIAPDCMTADAYATAFMVLGMRRAEEIIRKTPGLEAYFIYDENGKFKTTHVKSKL